MGGPAACGDDADATEFGVSLSAERTSDLDDIGVAVWLDLGADQQVRSQFERTAAYDEGGGSTSATPTAATTSRTASSRP